MLALLRFTLVLGAVALLVVAVVRRKRTIRLFKEFLLEPSSPVNIALLRILVFWAIFKASFGRDASWYAGLPKELRNPPFGWGWLRDFPLYEPDAMAKARSVLIVASACATLGLFTRVSVPTAVLIAVLGQAVTTFFEKVNHGNHAAMLCALALTFSPCGDALSLDRLGRWWRGQSAPAASPVYGLPMRVSWLLLGTTYLFPGVWKLWVSGDQWVSGERMAATLRERWETLETFSPPMRVDQYPIILALLGISTLVFEIGFIFALFNRVARVVAAFSAVAFHLGVRQVMAIPFPPYLPLILLLDFPQIGELASRVLPPRVRSPLSGFLRRAEEALTRFAARLRAPRPARPHPVRSIWPAAIAGILLFSGQSLAGVLHVSSWPISVFPTFRGRTNKGPRIGSDLRVEYQSQDGTTRDLRTILKRMGPARLKNLFKRLTPVRDEVTEKAIVDLFAYAGHVKVQPGDHVAVIRATWDLYPLGKMQNYREKLELRYAVREDGFLSLEYEAPKEKKEPSNAAKSSDSKGSRRAKKRDESSEELDE